MTASSMQTSIVGVALLATCLAAGNVPGCCRCATDVPTCCWRAGGGGRAAAIDGGSGGGRRTRADMGGNGRWVYRRLLGAVLAVSELPRPRGPDERHGLVDRVLAGDDDKVVMIRRPNDDGEENDWGRCCGDRWSGDGPVEIEDGGRSEEEVAISPAMKETSSSWLIAAGGAALWPQQIGGKLNVPVVMECSDAPMECPL
ncbi:hypothetical protein ACLOJK_003914 [Asimina triloba]